MIQPQPLNDSPPRAGFFVPVLHLAPYKLSGDILVTPCCVRTAMRTDPLTPRLSWIPAGYRLPNASDIEAN